MRCGREGVRGALRAAVRRGVRIPRATCGPRPRARSRSRDVRAGLRRTAAVRSPPWRVTAVLVRDRAELAPAALSRRRAAAGCTRPRRPAKRERSARGAAARLRARLARGGRERDALLLYAWADLSYAEIADALGVPVGTVRSRLHRARSRLREALTNGPDRLSRYRGVRAVRDRACSFSFTSGPSQLASSRRRRTRPLRRCRRVPGSGRRRRRSRSRPATCGR